MLRPRIIPCLLLRGNGLVKTVQFANPKYVGDPLNAVRIFNEKEVDELVVLDIDATVAGREPDYTLISNLAAECRMPLCYGGGIKTVEQAERIIASGVEKVALSSSAVANANIVSRMATTLGSQSVVVVVDVARNRRGEYEVRTHNGTRKADVPLLQFVRDCERMGAGEIVVNSIDNDGMMKGYDSALVALVREAVTVPLTALGGCGGLADLRGLVQHFGTIGAAAGSLFVFKGAYRAVLINYPNREDKDKLVA